MPRETISLVLSDVDGTLVTDDKRLTSTTVAAVARLHERGIAFAIVSSRPPRGMQALIGPLGVTTPVTGFNGGMIVDRDGRVLRRKSLDGTTTRQVLDLLDAGGVDAWFFSGDDWLLRKPDGAYVPLERMTIGYDSIVVEDFEPWFGTATKIVGVSDDPDRLAACEARARAELGAAASVVRSQTYYLDVTHPDANKGEAVLALSGLLKVPAGAICTVGDGGNDVLMFAQSGFSIAMGNADAAVKAQARAVTDGNEADGFARAVERYILPAGPAA